MTTIEANRSDPSRTPQDTPDTRQKIEVQRGETLGEIARKYGVGVDDMMAANPQIRNANVIYANQQIALPEGAVRSHPVARGETLSEIAQTFKVSVADLAAANNIRNPDRIYPGDQLLIPNAKAATESPSTNIPLPEPRSDGPADTPAVDTPVQTPADAAPVETPQVDTVAQPDAQPPATTGRFDYDAIVGVKGNPNVTPEFITRVEQMAERLGAKPEHLLAVMSFETGGTFSPAQPNNAGGSATGLIQFMPPTARGLGTTTGDLAKMTAVQQLDYVEKYFAQPMYAGKLGTLEGVYTSVLSGKAQNDPSATLTTARGVEFANGTAEYRDNKGLDFDRDGRITTGEATQAVAARLYGGTTAVQQTLVDAGAVPADQVAGFADGKFGPKTAAAIERLQAANGLPQTGVLDDATGVALTSGKPVPAAEVETPAAATPGDWPVPGRTEINAKDKPGEGDGAFGSNRNGGREHKGIDINGNVGDRIESYADGKVVFAGQMRGYGNTVIVQHADGLQTVYAHMDSITVRNNQTVTADTQVGTMGRTGNTPSGGDTHLHFEIRENANGVLTGTAVDPMKYLHLPL